MKTKEEDKTRAGADIDFECPRCAEGAEAGQNVPIVSTCPFGTSQTSDLRGLRHPST
jgi:hypothetical protein